LEIKLGETTIGRHPRKPVFMRVPGILQGRRIKVIKRMAYGFRDSAYFFLKIKAAFPGKAR